MKPSSLQKPFGRLAAGFVLAASLLSAQALEDVLARMDRAATGFRGITASVKKVSYTAVIKDTTEETGKISLFRPKPKELRMLVEFSNPDQRSVSFAGKKLQIYFPKMQLIQEYDLGKQGALLDQFLLLGFGTSGSELKENYEIKLLGTESIAGAKTAHLELLPKNPEAKAHVRQVELWIGEAEGQPLQQKILQPSRDYTLITYEDLKVNPAGLSEQTVKLTPPQRHQGREAAKVDMANAGKKTNRLAFLDWARGLAALTMLNGHVFHSFMRNDMRNDGPYVLTQFIGGLPPAMFLFLTGITLSFLMDSRTKAGDTGWQKIVAALLRARYLLVLAVLFRVQMLIFSVGKSPWTDLFRVDVLNSMALGLAAMAPLALLTTRQRVKFGALTGLAIAMVSPLISAANVSGIHPYLRAWFVPDANYFSFFPWGAYIAFGVAGGAILRLVQEEAMERVMLWSAFFGAALWAGSRYFADLPYTIYAHSDFWLNGPLLILIKTGIILMILPVAFLWTRYVNQHGWSVLRQLGTTSLLVYWVHTELVYGSLFWMFKENLNLWQVLAMSAFIITSMIALSMAKTGWGTHPAASVWFRQRWIQWRGAFAGSTGSVGGAQMPVHQPAGD